jgi:NADPH-dependent curcumin reductase CurA
VVSSAAGATGSVAGQIAKIKGCRVIGTAGGKEKCDWLVKEAHFDAAIDYESEDIGVRLSELWPNGIDVFFDNVGGAVLNEVLARINIKARIVLCGSISKSDPSEPGKLLQPGGKAWTHGGFHRARLSRACSRGLRGAGPVAAGRQTPAKGGRGVWSKNAPRALLGLFTGENFGKQLVKVADAAA